MFIRPIWSLQQKCAKCARRKRLWTKGAAAALAPSHRSVWTAPAVAAKPSEQAYTEEGLAGRSRFSKGSQVHLFVNRHLFCSLNGLKNQINFDHLGSIKFTPLCCGCYFCDIWLYSSVLGQAATPLIILRSPCLRSIVIVPVLFGARARSVQLVTTAAPAVIPPPPFVFPLPSSPSSLQYFCSNNFGLFIGVPCDQEKSQCTIFKGPSTYDVRTIVTIFDTLPLVCIWYWNTETDSRNLLHTHSFGWSRPPSNCGCLIRMVPYNQRPTFFTTF